MASSVPVGAAASEKSESRSKSSCSSSSELAAGLAGPGHGIQRGNGHYYFDSSFLYQVLDLTLSEPGPPGVFFSVL